MDSPAPNPRLQDQPEPLPQAEDHSVHCPNCSSRLTPLKCKMLCAKCGYYLSCSDFY